MAVRSFSPYSCNMSDIWFDCWSTGEQNCGLEIELTDQDLKVFLGWKFFLSGCTGSFFSRHSIVDARRWSRKANSFYIYIYIYIKQISAQLRIADVLLRTNISLKSCGKYSRSHQKRLVGQPTVRGGGKQIQAQRGSHQQKIPLSNWKPLIVRGLLRIYSWGFLQLVQVRWFNGKNLCIKPL